MNHLARMVSIVVVLVTLAVAPGASRAQGRAAPEPDAAQGAQLKALGQASVAPLHAGFDPDTGRVTTLRGRFAPAAPGRPAAARAFLAAHAALFRLRPDLGDLRLAREVDSPGGATLTFEQEHHGIPVFEGAVVVGFDRQGNIVHVQNAHVPDLTLPTAPAVSPYQAESVAESDLGAPFPQGEASVRLVFVRGDKGAPGHYLAWQVSVVLDQPRGDWHIFVDARTGQVVRRLNMAKSTGSTCACVVGVACGRVFDKSPVDRTGDLGLRDTSDPAIDATQVHCALANLESITNLDGSYANTSRTQSPRAAPPYDYLRSTNQRAVDEVTAYYHANRSKEYLNTLEFTGVMNFSIALDAHNAKLGDNAQYVPSGKYIELGEGGVDDAQDPDVIYHELGHAIQDNQVPGFGTTAEAAAIGEGFGDYWAAALTDDAFTSLGQACVAAWDATTYNPYSVSTPGSGCLRRVDGTKQFPRDLAIDEHANGEIWSAALWGLRSLLGATAADTLVVQSHYLLPVNATFINAADALLSADHTLNSDANATAIHAAMKAYGIPRTGASVLPDGMTAYVSASCQSSHRYRNLDYQECTLKVPGAARVRVRFSKFDTEAGYDFVYVTDADYGQVQRLSGKPFGKSGGYSAAVTGNTVVVRFRADSSIIGWGFAIDRVYYSTSP